jgi:hypothetical protein
LSFFRAERTAQVLEGRLLHGSSRRFCGLPVDLLLSGDFTRLRPPLVLDLRLGGRKMLSDGSKYRFLSGGGEMGALVRAFDWEESPLGSPDVWPQTLRTTVRLLLNSGHPMFIWYGPGLIQQ